MPDWGDLRGRHEGGEYPAGRELLAWQGESESDPRINTSTDLTLVLEGHSTPCGRVSFHPVTRVLVSAGHTLPLDPRRGLAIIHPVTRFLILA